MSKEAFSARIDRIVATREGGGGTCAAPRTRRRRLRFPWEFVLFTLVVFALSKAVIYGSFGDYRYSKAVDRIGDGTAEWQVLAWTLQADPVTVWLGPKVRATITPDLPETRFAHLRPQGGALNPPGPRPAPPPRQGGTLVAKLRH